MKQVVEYFEIRYNSFSRGLFLVLALLSAFAFVIGLSQSENSRWIALGGLVMFGGGWVMTFKDNIIVQPAGFEVKNLGRSKFIKWADVTELNFDIVYSIHSVHAELKIFEAKGRMQVLHVKQYQAKPMQRFFEILHEQCKTAYKNEHFIKQASGKMNWRNKLKML